MTTKQLNDLECFYVVQAFLNAEEKNLGQVPLFAPTKVKFDANVERIVFAVSVQKDKPRGKTVAKRDAESKLYDVVETTYSAVHTLAKHNGDAGLMEKNHKNRRELYQLRLSERLHSAELLYNDVLPLREQLKPFAVLDLVDTLKAAIDEVKRTTEDRNLTFVAKKASGQELAVLFDETNALLDDELHTIMLPYRSSNPNLFRAWEAARTVKNLGVSHSRKNPENGNEAQPAAGNGSNPAPAGSNGNSPATAGSNGNSSVTTGSDGNSPATTGGNGNTPAHAGGNGSSPTTEGSTPAAPEHATLGTPGASQASTGNTAASASV